MKTEEQIREERDYFDRGYKHFIEGRNMEWDSWNREYYQTMADQYRMKRDVLEWVLEIGQ